MFKILIVEDDKNLRKLITTYLRKNEYITYEATNGGRSIRGYRYKLHRFNN